MIKLVNVTKKFRNITAVNNVTFSVNKGDIFGYLGPNGAGKTTTIRLLVGLLMPNKGDIFIKDHRVNKKNLKDIKKEVGFLFENPGIYEQLTVYDNLDYFGQIYGITKKKRRYRIDRLLELFTLQDRKNSICYTLSKGMRHKLAIARSLIHDPSILIYDEPFSGIDPETQETIRNVIFDLAKKDKTIILTSHHLYKIQQICRRIAVIVRGRLKECDTTENIISKYNKPCVEVVLQNFLTVEDKKLIQSFDFISGMIDDSNKLKIYLKSINDIDKLIKGLIKNRIKFVEIKKNVGNLEDAYMSISKT